jgi:hypothetical protein
MLFFFLVPWIAFCLCLASPLPELFRARLNRAGDGSGSFSP